MDSPGPRARRVYVLGRGAATFDVAGAAREAAAEDAQLVLLTLGYPLTSHQRDAVDRAMDLAWEFRLGFDAMLVSSPKEAVVHAARARTVALVASGRERKTLERALKAAGLAVEPPSENGKAGSQGSGTPAPEPSSCRLEPGPETPSETVEDRMPLAAPIVTDEEGLGARRPRRRVRRGAGRARDPRPRPQHRVDAGRGTDQEEG